MSLPNSSSSDSQSIDKATLLFVDDERRVLSSMRAMFRRNYHVFVADSGQEALRIVDREQIDVVISDQRMPEMTGVEFLCAVKERAPAAMRILLTGYADLEAIEASINDGEVFRYLMKPCPPDDLKKAIAMAVEAARATDPNVEEIELQPVGRVQRGAPAELIPFPASRRSRRQPAPAPANSAGKTGHPNPTADKQGQPAGRGSKSTAPVDVLVLTADKALYSTINEVVEDQQVLRAVSVDQAVQALAEHRIGVMVTDTTVNEREVEALTKTLKHEVPELVTIIASDRSDAHTLISLINEGQIYRFLLKPVSRGQSRLWVTSAIRKFEELTRSSEATARHRVAASDETAQTGLLQSFRTGIAKLRARLRRD